MAGSGPKRPVGRPRGKGEAEPVTFTLPTDHYVYLRHLVQDKKRLGRSVNDAARHILIRELDAMFKADYHKKEIDGT
jgi:hypothetical protein